jgi:hypothetical protein
LVSTNSNINNSLIILSSSNNTSSNSNKLSHHQWSLTSHDSTSATDDLEPMVNKHFRLLVSSFRLFLSCPL